MYKIPSEHCFRLHHVRPRFKNQIDDVLLFMAQKITDTPPNKKSEFDKIVDNGIRMFQKNKMRTDKTIRNWRTEISAIFGLMLEAEDGQIQASDTARMLAESQDMVEFFKYFTYLFQYPGGHMKPERTKIIINRGIRFKPAKYILELMLTAEKSANKKFYLTRAEATHCIFNDLRVTKDNRVVEDVIELIRKNRQDEVTYDEKGDVVRYAGDILDYMVYANMLYRHVNRYYINHDEDETIRFFLNNDTWFSGFDHLYDKSIKTEDVRKNYKNWFKYVNKDVGKIDFGKNVLKEQMFNKIKDIDKEIFVEPQEKHIQEIENIRSLLGQPKLTTKSIGDVGEALTLRHECEMLRRQNLNKLVCRVAILPNQFAMGYDIKSYKTKNRFKHIEVKTTCSRHVLRNKNIHLTDNEWIAAQSYGGNYYIYRISIFQDKQKPNISLCVIRDPVQQLKEGKIQARKENGVDITYQSNACEKTELLVWKNSE